MVRHGQLVGIRKERLEEYIKYHKNVWPEILAKIKECNITNYSIYQFNEMLFAYFEYTGDDFDGDMKKMAADQKTQEWWSIMIPMQKSISGTEEPAEWVEMTEVFHVD